MSTPRFIALVLPGVLASVSAAPDLIVSANDAKYVRVTGVDTFVADAGPDTLTVLDATQFPPRVRTTVNVSHAIFGPPHGVAITPDGRIAVVSAPSHYDAASRAAVPDAFLQWAVLDAPAAGVRRLPLSAHPQGVAINRAGTLLLAATAGGTVATVAIEGNELRLVSETKVANERLSGICFVPDGSAALVALRDEQGLAVLDVKGERVSVSGERITTGLGPYTIDVAGRWAVVANAGLAAMKNPGKLAADADSITLVDLARRPFRAVQHATVPATPEAAVLSPGGRWVAVQAMNGSNLPASNPARNPRGRLVLFQNVDGELRQTAEVAGGEASQGIAFTADGRYLLVQYNVEKQIALFQVNDGKLIDTGERIATPGGPASIRAMPR